MLLFFEDGEDDIVLKVQNLIRSVTHIDYMEMPQFETQSTSSALEIRENQRRVFCYGQEILLTKTEYEIPLYLYKNANHVLTHGQIYERHRFFTQRLIAAGVDPETAAKEACHMEHGVSENSFEKLKQSMERQDKKVH